MWGRFVQTTILFMLPILLMVFIVFPLDASAKTINWRWANFRPVSDWTMPLAEQFVQDIETYTNGKMKIKMFTSGQLMPARQIHEAVSMNQIQMGYIYTPYLTAAAPIFGWTSLPFTGLSMEEHLSMYDEGSDSRKIMDNALHNTNLEIIFQTPAGSLNIISKDKPFLKVDDFKGIRIRAPGRYDVAAYETLGAAAVSLSPEEIYEGLKRGTLAASTHNYSSMLSRGLHEVANNIYVWDLSMVTYPLIVNYKEYNSLPSEVKEGFDKAAEKFRSQLYEKYSSKKQMVIESLKNDCDSTLHQVSKTERMIAREKVKNVYNQWVEDVGTEDAEKMLDIILTTASKN